MLYEFECKKCKFRYEQYTSFDATGKYPGVQCPECNCKRKIRLMSACSVAFGNPVGTSKYDSFSYRAGHKMEGAQDLRRRAEAKSHMGNTDEIYRPINDIDSGKHFGEIK